MEFGKSQKTQSVNDKMVCFVFAFEIIDLDISCGKTKWLALPVVLHNEHLVMSDAAINIYKNARSA